MSVDYTIAAIPTVYRGRRYRSRLEARWAAFFDALHWKHEYEPFDLGVWSPDFQLPKPESECWPLGTLAEVKPISVASDEPPVELTAKVERACRERKIEHDVNAVLLLGVAPQVCADMTMGAMPALYRRLGMGYGGRLAAKLGWHGYSGLDGWRWQPAFVYWVVSEDYPQLRPNIISWDTESDLKGGWPWACLFRDVSPNSAINFPANHAYPEHVMKLWAQATNDVQYQPEPKS